MSTTAAIPRQTAGPTASPTGRTGPAPYAAPRPVRRRAAPQGAGVKGLRVLRSEWTKLRSLRSTWITLLAGFAVLVGLGLVGAQTYHDGAVPSTTDLTGGDPAVIDALSVSLSGIDLAALAVGVLGVLATASEYATGAIRTTLTAVPRRLPALWAKAGLFGALSCVMGAAGAFAAFLGGQPTLAGHDIAASLGDPGVVRALLSTGLYLGLVGVLGVALGALIRSTAGGIGVLVGGLLVVPGLASLLLPDSVRASVAAYLPSNAGRAALTLTRSADQLPPWAGLAVMAGWAALLLALAATRLVKRDA